MIHTTASNGYIISVGNAVNDYQSFSIMFGSFSWGCNTNLGVDPDYSNTVYCPSTSTGKAVNDGLWHTVFVTYDGTTLSIYVDGMLMNTASKWDNDAIIATTLNTLGNSGNYLGQWFSTIYRFRWIGSLKNVMFYDYVVAYSDGKNIAISLAVIS